MKKFLLILLAIFLLIIASFGFMFYRSFDEEAYKAQIIASTKELTGRDMVINGQFSLEIFPSPVIRISDVVVKNKKGFDEDFLKIKSVEARIRFASLFKNPLIVDNIVLKNPEFVLQRNDKGENNWNLTFLTAKDKTIIQDDLIGKTFADLPPQFQNIQLENGKISYFNLQTEQKVVFTDINGKINSTSIDGPFDFVVSIIKSKFDSSSISI